MSKSKWTTMCIRVPNRQYVTDIKLAAQANGQCMTDWLMDAIEEHLKRDHTQTVDIPSVEVKE